MSTYKAKIESKNERENYLQIFFSVGAEPVAPAAPGQPAQKMAKTTITVTTQDPAEIEFYSSFRPGKGVSITIE